MRAISIQELATADCPVPGCVNAADPGSDYCRVHREQYRTPPARSPLDWGEVEPLRRLLEVEPPPPTEPEESPVEAKPPDEPDPTVAPPPDPSSTPEKVLARLRRFYDDNGRAPSYSEWDALDDKPCTMARVRQIYGGVGPACDAAGIPRPQGATVVKKKAARPERTGRAESSPVPLNDLVRDFQVAEARAATLRQDLAAAEADAAALAAAILAHESLASYTPPT